MKIGQNAVIFCLEVKDGKVSHKKIFLAFYSSKNSKKNEQKKLPNSASRTVTRDQNILLSSKTRTEVNLFYDRGHIVGK